MTWRPRVRSTLNEDISTDTSAVNRPPDAETIPIIYGAPAQSHKGTSRTRNLHIELPQNLTMVSLGREHMARSTAEGMSLSQPN